MERANSVDLDEIMNWLKCEYEEYGEGFWCNRNIIEHSFKEDKDLWVVRDDAKAVAFQVGDYSPDIVCVRKDMQREGIGSAFAQANYARAKTEGVTVISGECSPITSLPFWQAHGFELYGGSSRHVRRIVEFEHVIPKGSPRVEVEISCYSEEVKYQMGVEPFAIHKLEAGALEDGDLQLPKRVTVYRGDIGPGRDIVLRICIAGEERYFDKAKYEGAEALGVQLDCRGNAFFVDRIIQSPQE